MTNHVFARKRKSIEDYLRALSPSVPEEQHPLHASPTSSLQEFLQRYWQWMQIQIPLLDIVFDPLSYCDGATMEKLPLLSPADISIFLQTSMQYEHFENHRTLLCNILPMLMQKSYDTGYNHFQLSSVSLPPAPYFLPLSLKGSAERLLSVTITGDVTDVLGDGSEHVIYIIHGKVAYFSPDLAIQGINLYDKPPQHCIFKSPHLTTLKHLEYGVKQGRNELVHILPTGEERIIREL